MHNVYNKCMYTFFPKLYHCLLSYVKCKCEEIENSVRELKFYVIYVGFKIWTKFGLDSAHAFFECCFRSQHHKMTREKERIGLPSLQVPNKTANIQFLYSSVCESSWKSGVLIKWLYIAWNVGSIKLFFVPGVNEDLKFNVTVYVFIKSKKSEIETKTIYKM